MAMSSNPCIIHSLINVYECQFYEASDRNCRYKKATSVQSCTLKEVAVQQEKKNESMKNGNGHQGEWCHEVSGFWLWK
jgi:hypothetical protein